MLHFLISGSLKKPYNFSPAAKLRDLRKDSNADYTFSSVI